ncbi:glycosyltransferase [Ornithinimicrobium ciconiae]|uniref:D-inositol 3-phosphate glycosyltransferase n=1 Tax=Ornithinimicrobium ciconiae TaxID=2594265 RepID=A0A516GAV7_9MICO|nr:glycosyltransferase family 4 protein [Ornithinimicrobium ciconiae]QDO88647.1 glycosyltransferase [Ornithinimicrobium ciconiae]
MRVGLVCPYSFDVPGGVQLHIRDLAAYLIGRGHEVSVLAPADEDTELPGYVVSAGRAVPIRFNGSVARLSFGPIVANRVQDWLDDGDFDVLHLHEPAAPSLSLLALWAARVPVVATFHSSQSRLGALRAAQPLLQPGLDKISARIAVSGAAHQTMASSVGGTTLVIPNGVYVDRFCTGEPYVHDPAKRPRIVFLGRFDEPRKGLPVLLSALPLVLAQVPSAEVLVAGPGRIDEVAETLSEQVAGSVTFLGTISEEDKVRLLASANAYIAPNTGGESFGIILVEAMSAGAPVVASALDAFSAVIGGSGAGVVFPVGDHRSLAAAIVELLEDPDEQARLRAAGRERARQFDWSRVGARIEAVYDSVAVSRGDRDRGGRHGGRNDGGRNDGGRNDGGRGGAGHEDGSRDGEGRDETGSTDSTGRSTSGRTGSTSSRSRRGQSTGETSPEESGRHRRRAARPTWTSPSLTTTMSASSMSGGRMGRTVRKWLRR